jgi:DnaK suppressor protein
MAPTTAAATPVTTEQLPAFASQLQAMKAELLAQVRQQRGGELSRADAAAEVRSLAQGDWAQSDAERGLSVTLEERELAEINDIAAAQQRISDGSFGECSDCGAPIGVARLQANPVALRCIGCQTQQEEHGGRHPTA